MHAVSAMCAFYFFLENQTKPKQQKASVQTLAVTPFIYFSIIINYTHAFSNRNETTVLNVYSMYRTCLNLLRWLMKNERHTIVNHRKTEAPLVHGNVVFSYS